MAENVLKNYRKFIIQRIINPSVYWMTEYEKGMCYKRQLKEFECLLSKNVHRIKEKDDVHIGTMVAVKDETDFHRGIVTDIFNRKFEVIYLIILVDYGITIETTEKHLYFINNKELRSTQFSAFEVTIQGIQPSVLDVDYEKNFESGVFQKRVCHTWSSTAFQFVRNLLKRNPCAFVKPLHTNQRKISGEIYFLQECDKKLVSLGQLLCDKGFAVLSNVEGLQGEDKKVIEGKIPKSALFRGLQESQAAETPTEVHKESYQTQNSSASVQKAFKVQNRCSSLYSTKTAFESENLKSSTSTPKPGSNFYSSSWMLKKCLQQYALTPPNESLKKQGIQKNTDFFNEIHKGGEFMGVTAQIMTK